MQHWDFISLLKLCKTPNQLKQIQTQIITRSLESSNRFLISQFISKSILLTGISYAQKMFDQTLFRNTPIYNTMFKGYLDNEMHNKSFMMFDDMISKNVKPNRYTFPMILKSCRKLMALVKTEELHSLVLKVGFKSNTYVGSALIDTYSSLGQVRCAERVFDEMVLRNVVTWTSMMNGFVSNGDLISARKLFDLAPERDVVLWNNMVSAYIRCGNMIEARKLFDMMPGKDLMSWNTLLNGYMNNGDIEGCEKLFHEMQERNIFSWNALIGGYAHNGMFFEVLSAFKMMLDKCDLQPNDATLVHVLTACARLGALDLGKWAHLYAENNGYKDNVFVCNALIDMYAKCGMIESATDVFRKLGNKDLISWNTIINGLAVHGHGAEALSLFSEMKMAGEKPDGITYIGIFCACSHMGLVEDAFTYFQSMFDDYSIEPQIEHYGCMVDVIARAGLLGRALDFVNKMPIKADGVIWTALLGACRMYKNSEIAELALLNLIQIEPNNPSNYVMLANIYADSRRWEDMARLKVAMRNTGSRKVPGCSFVEVDNVVVQFYCFDERHSRTDEIYDSLMGLMRLSQSSGCTTKEIEFFEET